MEDRLALEEKYNKLCFECEEKRNSLLNFHPDIFVLQHKINQTIEELHSLEMERDAVKAELDKSKEG